MPVQAAFTLLILGGAFTTTGALLGSLNWLETGQRKRSVAKSHWGHHLEQRDLALQKFLNVKDEL
jgi:hypothetical protein